MLKRGHKRKNSVKMLSEMRICAQFLISRKMNNVLHDIFRFGPSAKSLQVSRMVSDDDDDDHV